MGKRLCWKMLCDISGEIKRENVCRHFYKWRKRAVRRRHTEKSWLGFFLDTIDEDSVESEEKSESEEIKY